MPQLALSEKLTQLPNHSQHLDRLVIMKAKAQAANAQNYPNQLSMILNKDLLLPRGPTRVPLRRISENKSLVS